jgi:hypothetical protein
MICPRCDNDKTVIYDHSRTRDWLGDQKAAISEILDMVYSMTPVLKLHIRKIAVDIMFEKVIIYKIICHSM